LQRESIHELRTALLTVLGQAESLDLRLDNITWNRTSIPSASTTLSTGDAPSMLGGLGSPEVGGDGRGVLSGQGATLAPPQQPTRQPIMLQGAVQ
jgi:hypothetical protein